MIAAFLPSANRVCFQHSASTNETRASLTLALVAIGIHWRAGGITAFPSAQCCKRHAPGPGQTCIHPTLRAMVSSGNAENSQPGKRGRSPAAPGAERERQSRYSNAAMGERQVARLNQILFALSESATADRAPMDCLPGNPNPRTSRQSCGAGTDKNPANRGCLRL